MSFLVRCGPKVSRLSQNPKSLLNNKSWPKALQLPGVASVTVCSALKNEESWGKTVDYKGFKKARNDGLNELLNSPKRFQSIKEREDRSDIPVEAIQAHMQGKYFMHHRGCWMLKTADDQAILKELLYHIRPATIIELGVFTGGNAVWMSDMLKLMEIDCHIYGMDIELSLIEDGIRKIKPDNVTFLQGDSTKIEETFPEKFIKGLPRPLIVIEDTHINTLGILEYFVKFMEKGDYFMVEDTSPILPARLGPVQSPKSEREYSPISKYKLDCVKKFLTKYEKEFAVDSFFTDFFGYNGTWNWHGFIRQM